MKKLLLLFLLIGGFAYGQTPNSTVTKFTNGLGVPNGSTLKPTTPTTPGYLSYVDGDGLYVWNGSSYVKLGLSGTGVTSFNARAGAVTSVVGDYSSFYPLLNGTGATGTWGINISGSAATLTTGRTIGTLTGDATSAGSSFNGSANNTNAITLATVNSNVGSFTNATVTVNGKGLVTAVANGTTPITPADTSVFARKIGNSAISIFNTLTTTGNITTPAVLLKNGAGTTAISGSTTNQSIVFPALSGIVPIFAGTPVASGIVGWSGTGGALTTITALPNGTTATTQSPGDNSTKVATTAYVDATGAGTVTSVSGTTNRITSTGGTTPVIDISASYVGQSSITTVGALTSGSLASGFLPVTNALLANSAITINGTSVSLGGTRTLSLASSDFANQGTTTTVLHGNASGNPSFGAISLTADVTGTLPIGNGGTGNTTGSATNIGITDDVTTNATMYPTWVTANTGNLPAKVSSTKLSFNPSTGALNMVAGNVMLTASGADQYLRSNTVSATAKKGLYLSNGASTDWKIYAGGNQALGSYSEGINTLVIGTGLSGGGGSSELTLFYSTGRGAEFAIDAQNQLNTSFFPLVVPDVSYGSGWNGDLSVPTKNAIWDAGFLASSSLGTGVATWLGTPSSANLRSALTDESGTGSALFQNGDIGFATGNSLTLTSTVGTALSATAPAASVTTAISGVANGGIGVLGTSTTDVGVEGISTSSYGVLATSTNGVGLRAQSTNGNPAEFRGNAGTVVAAIDNTGALSAPSATFSNTVSVGTGAGTGNTVDIRNSGAIGQIRLGSSAGAFYYDVGRENVSTGDFVVLGNQGPSSMRLTTTGDFTISGSNATKATGLTWVNPSDSRLKTNVRPYTKGLTELLKIDLKLWNFNKASGLDTTKTHVSAIAQELEKVMPEMVSQYKGKLNGEDTVLKQVDGSDFIMLLINSVKELSAEVDLLKQK